jgi:hypothetical protein
MTGVVQPNVACDLCSSHQQNQEDIIRFGAAGNFRPLWVGKVEGFRFDENPSRVVEET